MNLVSNTLRIDLSFLIHNHLIVKGKRINGQLEWRMGVFNQPISKINITTCYQEDGKYIHLRYKTMNKITKSESYKDYKIELTTVKSNLGKGEVLYFICPATGKRCRVLYMAYDSDIWKSRGAYEKKIYYPSQKYSKRQYALLRYGELQENFAKVQKARYTKLTYKGKPTKTAYKMEKLYHDLKVFRKKKNTIVEQNVAKLVEELEDMKKKDFH